MHFAKVLTTNSTLQCLELGCMIAAIFSLEIYILFSGNRIGDEGAIQIAQVLATNNHSVEQIGLACMVFLYISHYFL